MSANTFDGLPPIPAQEQIACVYTNHGGELQILRIENVAGWYFERVIFSDQTLAFYATREAIAQIYSCGNAGCLLDDRIRCLDLQVEATVLATAESTSPEKKTRVLTRSSMA